jgi:hypothetical protein
MLQAVEGTPSDVFERQAAQLRMRSQDQWKPGSKVRYTALRYGEPTQVTVQLQKVRGIDLFKTQFLGESPSNLMGRVMRFTGMLVFLLRPHERAVGLSFWGWLFSALTR